MTEALRYSNPYIPLTDTDRTEMLSAVGIISVDELFQDIPRGLLNPNLNLPAPMVEQKLAEHLEVLAGKNVASLPRFLGAGRYAHFIPAAVAEITSRPEFLTAYTPYQAEISQGTLQAGFEAQTIMCSMMEMDVANAGMYDGATALAEAALMSTRVTGRNRVVALNSVHPSHLETVRTYLEGQDITLDVVSPDYPVDLDKTTASVLLQSPNYFGYLVDQKSWMEKAHQVGALGIVSVDNILSLGMLKGPGAFGADVAVGEGSSLGSPLMLGGQSLGIFTAREKYVRQMPGRIIGQTTDTKGRTGYILTLQTREQHIRREKATSNICTASQLVTLGFTVYASLLGPEGFKKLAELNYDRAHYAAWQIARLPRFMGFMVMEGDFFNEFVVTCPKPPAYMNKRLLEEGIIGGKDISDQVSGGMLVCVTEQNSRKQIDQFIDTLERIKK